MLTLLGLNSVQDCLAHLEVLEGSSERGPNKQGLEKYLWALVRDDTTVCQSR